MGAAMAASFLSTEKIQRAQVFKPVRGTPPR